MMMGLHTAPLRTTMCMPPVLLLAAVLVGGQEESLPQSSEKQWFCSHTMPWDECKKYLPSERLAIGSFLVELDERAPLPLPDVSFSGQGIVMSGGQGHVLMALANLQVIRKLGCTLPVEFWHAFELKEPHCEALAKLGATCRQLQMPGVYPRWQTVMPAILASSFRHVFWLDTDITPLTNPTRLFATQAYDRLGAMFWPDLWNSKCALYGETSWPHHIAWHLLDMEYNVSDQACSHEHEAGHMLIDKERHWRPLLLANYLASRDFFTRVLWGYKDVFRLAWLKLRASNWLSPVRPGLVGLQHFGKFHAAGLVHFWPVDDEISVSSGELDGRNVPLYIHQKKVPGSLWNDILTFRAPMDECVEYKIPLFPDEANAELWQIPDKHTNFATLMHTLDKIWDDTYKEWRDRLLEDERLTDKELNRLRSTRNGAATKGFMQQSMACHCDYGNHWWLHLLSTIEEKGTVIHFEECNEIDAQWSAVDTCPIGFLTMLLMCSQTRVHQQQIDEAKTYLWWLEQLLPNVTECLPHSFWPLRVDHLYSFVEGTKNQDSPDLTWRHRFDLDHDILGKFPGAHRRCMPLKDPSCWWNKGFQVRHLGPQNDLIAVEPTCMWCCDSVNRKIAAETGCFDDYYTEQRCCNPVAD